MTVEFYPSFHKCVECRCPYLLNPSRRVRLPVVSSASPAVIIPQHEENVWFLEVRDETGEGRSIYERSLLIMLRLVADQDVSKRKWKRPHSHSHTHTHTSHISRGTHLVARGAGGGLRKKTAVVL